MRYSNRYQLNPVVPVALYHLMIVLLLIFKWILNRNTLYLAKSKRACLVVWSSTRNSSFGQQLKLRANGIQQDIYTIKDKIVQNRLTDKVSALFFGFLSFKRTSIDQSGGMSSFIKTENTQITLKNSPVLGDAIQEYKRQYGLKGVKYSDDTL